MQWVSGLIEHAVLIALALGATSAVWLLQGCILATRKLQKPSRPDPFQGGALFLFLLLGVPILAVAWGFATGRLPAAP